MNNKFNQKLMVIIAILSVLILVGGTFAIMQKHNHVDNHQTQPTKEKKTPKVIKKAVPEKQPAETKKTETTAAKPTAKEIIPKQFAGKWYMGDKVQMEIGSDTFNLGGTQYTTSSLPIQVMVKNGPNGTYNLYHNPNPNASSAEGGMTPNYWIATDTIDGKKQRVLAAYEKNNMFQVYTSEPTSKYEGIQYMGDFSKYIGTPDLDVLKNQN
ncbi:hypothetical protein ACQW5G_03860 [Fructilactobacillus sp. Tb1]|uniref:hypothetical protein n=1 Tax=Fructilactobacillus sp. Tb1 TaxID=3422304 RepID=UPI003D29994D